MGRVSVGTTVNKVTCYTDVNDIQAARALKRPATVTKTGYKTD